MADSVWLMYQISPFETTTPGRICYYKTLEFFKIWYELMIRYYFTNINVMFYFVLIVICFSCVPANKMNKFNPSDKQDLKVPKSEANRDNIIVPIPEMTSTKEIEAFKFTNEKNPPDKDLLLKKLNIYSLPIQNVNLIKLSGWAKKQMQNYKLPDNFLDNAFPEQLYKTKDLTVLKLRVIELPSHTPIVKRFLYLIPVYDSSTFDIKKIYITIEGHSEE